MNKAIKAMLATTLAIGMLISTAGIAEEAMVVEPLTVSEPSAGEITEILDTPEINNMSESEENPTEEPVQTAVPLPTEEPVQTAVPLPTEEPAQTAVPLPTEQPESSESIYTVSFLKTDTWTNSATGFITIQITDVTGTGIQKAEFNPGNGWTDITTDYYISNDGKISIPVSDNGTVTVRLTDPFGHTSEQSAEVNIFDRDEPAIQASIESENLHIQAMDNFSGVAGVQVNGLLFTTIENGILDIKIPGILSKYDHLAIRAFDYAGNFSSPVTIDNPFYIEPTTVPQNTPEGTPVSTPESTQNAYVTATPVIVTQEPVYTNIPSTPTPQITPQIIYIQPDPTPTPVIEKEYIPIGPGMPYLADGNSHTLDVLYSAATNKQFITMQTKSGNTFYLVIDYDKPIDEEAEMYETYFLNLVDERDLMSLMSEEEMPSATPQVIYVTPEPTVQPAPTSTPTTVPVETEKPSAKAENSQLTGIIALVVLLVAGGGIALFLIKSKGKKNSSKSSSGYDFDDMDEDEEEDDEDKPDTEE